MSENKDSHFTDTLVTFLAGAAAGFVPGILFAPASGKETRKKIKDQAAKTGEMAKEGYEKIVKEAEKGIRIVKEKTGESIEAIKEFIEKQGFTSQRLFIEDLTHELKTPLAVLKGELEVTLKRRRSAREYKSVLESSLEEIDRIIRIVEDLLVLARLEKGVAALDKEDLEAGELVAQCVEDIRVLAEPKGISVRFESKDGTNVRGDSVKLRQLFLNVLDNAIKYTPPGGEVAVEVVREEEWVKITVRDTGPGIPEKDLPRIFGRFFRGQGHGREKGFGLGLSIAKAIAEAHGGRIEVSTAAGGGTCFDMFLPIRPPARFSAVSGDPSVLRKH